MASVEPCYYSNSRARATASVGTEPVTFWVARVQPCRGRKFAGGARGWQQQDATLFPLLTSTLPSSGRASLRLNGGRALLPSTRRALALLAPWASVGAARDGRGSLGWLARCVHARRLGRLGVPPQSMAQRGAHSTTTTYRRRGANLFALYLLALQVCLSPFVFVEPSSPIAQPRKKSKRDVS